ncbi:tryptophan ABC transporter substrate-binding protein [Agrilactobacillus yilanensis]|uniref:Tryptophan ABC transporter substrate-binding protein n=1 Tax=Agrilactobacillus yilanensis TaxID=2485997 RepID=A0ABW4JAE6_9LACO|nr:tryptophan ABC transporter substrate-binding protein [Agrilactobacillus yilanensis]
MKRMLVFIAALLAFLVAAFFMTGKTSQKIAETPTVGILQLTSHPALDAIHKGIVSELAKAGYSEKKHTLKIDFQNAENDQSNLKTMSERFKDENVDVMVGIATPAAQALADVTTTTPIVLGAVTDPMGAGLVKHNKKPGANITGVSDQAPIKAQLDLIKQIMPNLKTLGVLSTSSDDSAQTQVRKLKAIVAKDPQLTLKTYTVTSTNDVNQVAGTMVNEVDAVYVPTDNTIASAMQTLVQVANSKDKPVFPAVDTMVEDGGLATISINQYRLGQETGKMVAAILKGQSTPATTPINFIQTGDLVINLKAAQKLNIQIPQNLIDQAKAKGELIQ